MKPKTRLIIPPATETEWRWREYKAYVAICGDYADYEVIKGKAVKLTTMTILIHTPILKLTMEVNAA